MEIKTKPISRKKQHEETKVENVQKVDKPSSLNYFEIKDFPSKKIPYRDLFLELRPYTWAEQKALASMNNIRDMIKIVENGVRSNIPLGDLTDGDFMWVALMRKLYSYPNSKFTGTVNCKHCGEKISRDFNFFDIEFEEIGVSNLPVKISGGGVDIEMTPISISDLFDVIDSNNGRVDEAQYIAHCIKGIPFNQALEIAKNADIELGEIFEQVVEKFRHSVKPVNFCCPSCGKITSTDLDPHGKGVVLSPFHGEENTPRYTVSFG